MLISALDQKELAMGELKLEEPDRLERMAQVIVAAPKHIVQRLNEREGAQPSGTKPYDVQSSCTSSFSRYELSRTRLKNGCCPVKGCRVDVKNYHVPFQKRKGTMIYLPFCPEHGIRVHTNGFVYYNGRSLHAKMLATKRNLSLNPPNTF